MSAVPQKANSSYSYFAVGVKRATLSEAATFPYGGRYTT